MSTFKDSVKFAVAKRLADRDGDAESPGKYIKSDPEASASVAPRTPPVHVPQTPPLQFQHVPRTPPLRFHHQPSTPPLGKYETLPDSGLNADEGPERGDVAQPEDSRAGATVVPRDASNSDRSGSPTLMLGAADPGGDTFHATESEAEKEEPSMKKPAKAEAKTCPKVKAVAKTLPKGKAKAKTCPKAKAKGAQKRPGKFLKKPSGAEDSKDDGFGKDEAEPGNDKSGEPENKTGEASMKRQSFNDGDWSWEEKGEGDDKWRVGTCGDWKAGFMNHHESFFDFIHEFDFV